MKKIALVSSASVLAEEHHIAATEDRLLADALAARDIQCHRLAWDGDHPWERYELLLVRATWDYFDRPAEFTEWIARPAVRERLRNPSALVHWNHDKRYLAELAQAGVPTIETLCFSAGEELDLAGLFERKGWQACVVKPTISGGGEATYRLDAQDRGNWPAAIALARERAVIVQPFIPEVLDAGEMSIILFGGQVQHSVRKRAADGEFRVQSIHGGRMEPYQPDARERAFALEVCAACPLPAVYARVDYVPTPAGPLLMEVELIEPDLFMRTHPASAQAFAQALIISM